MKKKLIISIFFFPLFVLAQSYKFDSFVEVYHEVPWINYKGSQVLLLNTLDKNITAFSNSDSTFTIYDNRRNLGHSFLNKTNKNKYSFIYKKSFKLSSKIGKHDYIIKNVADKKYEIIEYKNQKRKIITFRVIIMLETSEINLLGAISSDIGEKRRQRIKEILENAVGNKEKLKIVNQLTYYSRENIIDEKTVNSGSVNITMTLPAKLNFKN